MTDAAERGQHEQSPERELSRATPGFWQPPLPDHRELLDAAFGVGVRQRSAAVAVQVSTATTYTTPPANAISL